MKTIFLTFFIISSLFGEWAHLELGAGNYGGVGYSKASQKEVISRLEVTDKPNYVDRLPEKGYGNYDPYEQYAVLFWTFDQLVKRYGDQGIFHVNDICKDYATEAAKQLKIYALKQGYKKIKIDSIPIDYMKLDPNITLGNIPLGKLYDTVHLKNPEVTLFNEKMDGDDFYSSPKSRESGRRLLKKLAALSKTGLAFFTLYDNVFFPDAEKKEYVEKGLFYHETLEWEPVPYVFPRGQIIHRENGKVFYINGTAN